MVAIYDDNTLGPLKVEFIERDDRVIRHGDAANQLVMLPGCRGVWPMSAFDSSGNAMDASGHGHSLLYTGNPTYNYEQDGFIPYIDLDGANDYLRRGDEADLDIRGNESYVASAAQGLTFGGWFYFDNAASAQEVCMSKGGGAVGDTAYWINREAAGQGRFILGDGAAFQGPTSTVVIGATTWTHLIGRFVPSTSADLYQDGVKYSDTAGIPATLLNSAAPLNIGSYNNTGLLEMDGRASLCFLCACNLPDALIIALYQSQRHIFGV